MVLVIVAVAVATQDRRAHQVLVAVVVVQLFY
jgi:hypothetical protein